MEVAVWVKRYPSVSITGWRINCNADEYELTAPESALRRVLHAKAQMPLMEFFDQFGV